MQSLIAQHYAKRTGDTFWLSNPQALLEDWGYDYQRRNKPTVSGLYYPLAGLQELMDKIAAGLESGYAFSGLAGASLIDPFAHFDAIDLLVQDSALAEETLETLGAKRVDRGANINLIVPYYSVSAFFGVHAVSDKLVVSDLQLYLDLLCQPIRGTEAAEHLYERRLAHLLKPKDRN
jgi:hypothetical protein